MSRSFRGITVALSALQTPNARELKQPRNLLTTVTLPQTGTSTTEGCPCKLASKFCPFCKLHKTGYYSADEVEKRRVPTLSEQQQRSRQEHATVTEQFRQKLKGELVDSIDRKVESIRERKTRGRTQEEVLLDDIFGDVEDPQRRKLLERARRLQMADPNMTRMLGVNPLVSDVAFPEEYFIRKAEDEMRKQEVGETFPVETEEGETLRDVV